VSDIEEQDWQERRDQMIRDHAEERERMEREDWVMTHRAMFAAYVFLGAVATVATVGATAAIVTGEISYVFVGAFPLALVATVAFAWWLAGKVIR
jgi:hypothetical protein